MSPPARSVDFILNELNIPHNSIQVHLGKGEQTKPEFLKINPSGQVPVIQENESFCLSESRAILTYLIDKYRPDPDSSDSNSEVYKLAEQLYPKSDLKKRAIIESDMQKKFEFHKAGEIGIAIPMALKIQPWKSTIENNPAALAGVKSLEKLVPIYRKRWDDFMNDFDKQYFESNRNFMEQPFNLADLLLIEQVMDGMVFAMDDENVKWEKFPGLERLYNELKKFKSFDKVHGEFLEFCETFEIVDGKDNAKGGTNPGLKGRKVSEKL